MNIVLTNKEKRLAIVISAVFVLTVLAPGIGEKYASDDLSEQQEIQRNLQNEIADLESRLSGIEGEREAVRTNRADYVKWVRQGVVGEQDPVEWIKIMQKIQEDRNLFPLSYNFSDDESLRASSESPFTEESTVSFRLWDMNMEMAMLHDLDVLMFLEVLSQSVTSFFYPIECDFTSLHDDFVLINRQNVAAKCTLTWISVDDPEKRDDVIAKTGDI